MLSLIIRASFRLHILFIVTVLSLRRRHLWWPWIFQLNRRRCLVSLLRRGCLRSVALRRVISRGEGVCNAVAWCLVKRSVCLFHCLWQRIRCERNNFFVAILFGILQVPGWVLLLAWKSLVVLGSYPRGHLWYCCIGVNNGIGRVDSNTGLKL